MAGLSGRSRARSPAWSRQPGRGDGQLWTSPSSVARCPCVAPSARHPLRPGRRAKVCGSCMPARMDRKASNEAAGPPPRPSGPRLVGRRPTLSGSRTVSGGVASRGRRCARGQGDPRRPARPARRADRRVERLEPGLPSGQRGRIWGGMPREDNAAGRKAPGERHVMVARPSSGGSWPTGRPAPAHHGHLCRILGGETWPLYYNTVVRSIHR